MLKECEKSEPLIKRLEELADLYKSDEAAKELQLKFVFEVMLSSDNMKKVLVEAYGLSKDHLKKKFCSSFLKERETERQYMARLTSYLDQWILKDGTPLAFKRLRHLMRTTHFECSWPPELISQLRVLKVNT